MSHTSPSVLCQTRGDLNDVARVVYHVRNRLNCTPGWVTFCILDPNEVLTTLLKKTNRRFFDDTSPAAGRAVIIQKRLRDWDNFIRRMEACYNIGQFEAYGFHLH